MLIVLLLLFTFLALVTEDLVSAHFVEIWSKRHSWFGFRYKLAISLADLNYLYFGIVALQIVPLALVESLWTAANGRGIKLAFTANLEGDLSPIFG